MNIDLNGKEDVIVLNEDVKNVKKEVVKVEIVRKIKLPKKP